MAARHRLRTERLELLAASAELLEAEMLGREALSRRLRARIPGDWPPEGFDRPFVEWAAGEVRKRPSDAGWLVWFVIRSDEPEAGADPDAPDGEAFRDRAGGARGAPAGVEPPHDPKARRAGDGSATDGSGSVAGFQGAAGTGSAGPSESAAGERTLIGTCGFKGRPSQEGTVELGYSVLAEFQRGGLATEAVAALLDWAFIHRSVSAAIAETRPENVPSIRVIEKNRFRPAGPGREAGMSLYRLARADHQAARLERQAAKRSAGEPSAGTAPAAESGQEGGSRPDRAKTPPCPRCGSRDVAAIAYGFPDPMMFDAASRGEIELGGCIISDDSPRWRCRSCESEWGRLLGSDADD